MSADNRSVDGLEDAVEGARARLAEAREALAAAERALGQVESKGEREAPQPSPETPETTWRERFWTAPAECRVGVQELTEAVGVSESWIYQRTRKDADPRLPHAKIGGSLTFKVGELRAWIRDHETVEEAYRMEPTAGELRAVEGGAS